MSRILIDLTDAQVEELAALVQTEHRSRAAIIREAIESYIAQRKRPAEGEDVFGAWKGRQVDGLDYQRELRSEW
ncbi:ribbon-helix-helix protein, CopG family [Paraburkholderia unamae]|uniref:Ribbon-helix-helix CopG family protein n=1 Tax=Paraburkholderia unamae TaxID=219649 RepID=A0ABX5KM26_9BURK|nr:ribbon-helix-helix protein, CopG family [Paraburkholderia unamae]PVX83194.1 ribbon-helix-helix CopG family protein [Paraburkholderia unamae]CAG9261381.1 CopG family transcriptional regulator [Paraburkholderia unamae]